MGYVSGRARTDGRLPFAGGGGGPPIVIASSDSSVIVAEAPAGTFDLTVTAASIPSSGPSDVQADLDLFGGSVATSVKKFETWAEFTQYAVEAPAGTWTFDQPLKGAGTIIMPVGAQVIGGETSALGVDVPGTLTFLADVDAPVFTGPMQINGVNVIQQNAGASAVGFLLTSSAGRIIFLQSVQVIGGRIGYIVGAANAPVRLNSSISVNAGVGYQVTGAAANVLFDGCSATSAVPGFVGFEVAASATTTGGILAQTPSLVLTAGQFGFAIAHAATFTSPALMQIAGAANTGPQDAMIRQTAPGVTDMDIEDVRLVIKGGPSIADWAAVGIASRTDTSDPLIVTFAMTDTDEPIPYEDGAGNLELVSSAEDRFVLFKNVADPDDWYWEYQGPIEGATATIVTEVLHDRSAGTGFAQINWKCDEFPAYPGFGPVPNSDFDFENTNAVLSGFSATLASGLNKGDRLKPFARNIDDTTSLRLQKLKTELRVT